MAGIFGGGAPANSTIQAASGMRVQTSMYGLPVALMWGTVRAPVNVLWYGDFQAFEQSTGAGKGGGSITTGYSYQAAVAMALGEGPITAVARVWRGKEVSDGATLGLSTFPGSTSQSPWGYLTTYHPGADLAYPGLAYVASGSYQLGNSPDLANHTIEVAAQLATVGGLDANPADVLEDFLGNERYGVPGWSNATMLDGAADMRAYCLAQGLHISPLWSQPKPAAEYVEHLLRITNCDAVASQGKLRIMPRTDKTRVFAIAEDELFAVVKRASSATGATSDDAYNVVRINGLNRGYDYNPDPSTATDQVNIAMFGRRELPTIEAREFCDVGAATRSAQLILQRGLFVRQRYTVKLPITRVMHEPGDVGTIPYRGRSIDVRIIEVQRDGEALTWTCEEYFDGLGDAVGVGTSGGGSGPDYNAAPGPTNTPLLVNAPEWLTGGTAQVWMGVSGTGNWGGCGVWVSVDGTTYRRVGTHSARSRYGTLTASLAIPTADPDILHNLQVQLADTTQSLLNVSTDVAQGNGSLILVDSELMCYVGSTPGGTAGAYTLDTLYRARKGSNSASHASGATFLRLDSKVFRYTYDSALVGKTIYVKLTSVNVYGYAEQSISDVTAHTITLAPIARPSGAADDYIQWT